MRRIIHEIIKFPRKVIIFFIKQYQIYLSPRFGRNCKYYPTCSNYAICAIDKYGIIKGGIMAFFRILRCNPLSKRWNR